jgi:CheY-like chemotaxis protein/DNA-directed RNA polymerase subunit RPC12/RpoP
MDYTCTNCEKTIQIPDEKVPDKPFTIACPHCKTKNKIDPNEAGSTEKKKSVSAQSSEKKESAKTSEAPPPVDEYDSPDQGLQYFEEGVEMALLCEISDTARHKIKGVLESMRYHVIETNNPREALKKMRFTEFDLVVLNEMFGTRDPEMNHVLKYIAGLPMRTRRNMFLVLLTDRFPTMDSMAAFNKSANMVIHLNDIDHFEKILKKGVSDNAAFYRVFKESMKKLGRI